MRRTVWFIFFLFIAVRLLLVFHIPIFNDESTYMRWAVGFLADPSRWWAWMLDGKQPAVAATFGLSQLLPIDPIISMRLVSIIWSCITFWTVYFLFRRLSLRSVHDGLLLLAFCPFLIFFDTLALAESAMTATFAVALYLTISLIDRPKVWKGIVFGVTLAAGWWFKSTVLLAVPLMLLSLLVTWKKWKKDWMKMLVGLGIGVVVGFSIVTPVIFNPNIDYGHTEVIARTMTASQMLRVPISHWIAVVESVVMWFLGFGGPLLVVAGLAAAWQLRKNTHAQILVLWIVASAVMEIVGLASLSARLLAFTMVPLIILVAIWLSGRKNRFVVYILVGSLVLSGGLLSISPLAFYKALAPLPAAQGDFSQYVTSWPSGWGVAEAVQLLINESQKQHFIVFVRLDGGNPEDAIMAYMKRNHVPVFYVEQMPQIEQIPEARAVPWYFVSRRRQFAGLDSRLTQLAIFKKPLDDEFVGVYRINH